MALRWLNLRGKCEDRLAAAWSAGEANRRKLFGQMLIYALLKNWNLKIANLSPAHPEDIYENH